MKFVIAAHLALVVALPAFAGPGTMPTSRPATTATTQPASITLHLKDASARAALDAFSAQAGTPLPLVSPEQLAQVPPVTLDLDRQPFWTALEALGRKTGLEPITNAEDALPRFQLSLGNGAFWEEPHAVAGPVVVFANDVTRTNTVELGKRRHQVERELEMNLTAFVEPGLRVLAVSQEVALKSAVDENGRSLKPSPDAAGADEEDARGNRGGRMPEAGVYRWTMGVELDCPAAAGKRIASLVGALTVRVQTADDRVEIDNVLKARNVSRKVAGVPFTFKNLGKVGDDYHLQFAMQRDRTPAAQWRDLRHSAYQGHMVLYDEKGRVVSARAGEQNGDYGNNKVDATLRFAREPGLTDPAAGEPYKLVWLAPAQARTITVEFHLRDLPLPE